MLKTKRPHETPWWRLPECTGMNRLPGRSLLLPLEEEPVSLDGDWLFRLYDSPDAVPEEALSVNYREKGMQSIPVPSDWSSCGLLKPNYLRDRPPFVVDPHGAGIAPPELPEHNPTGLYRRSFSMARMDRSRRYVLHLAGVESAAAVYVNGRLAGYGKDSSTPLEFDVSSYIVKGANQVAVVVPRYCDGSYLESADRWWFGGIYRSVFVYSTSAVHFSDVKVEACPTPEFDRCRFGLELEIGFPGVFEAGYRVEALLKQPNGQAVPNALLSGVVDSPSGRLRLAAELEEIQLWSAEVPVLYSVELCLHAPNGSKLDTVGIPVGFRRVEHLDGQLLLNGQPLMLVGVNRDEHDRNGGRTLSRGAMEAELALMKRLSINAVRTTHRPQDPYWYELCDRYGVYVVDEPALASGVFGDRFARSTRWSSQILERSMRTVLRDKNHPSVILWSLGADSGCGPNYQAAAAWIRSYDPSRPLMYEGDRPHQSVGDIVAPLHPTLEQLEDLSAHCALAKRPCIAAAYSSSMGNSNGSLHEYVALFNSSRYLQGGFVERWMDRALSARAGSRHPENRGRSAVAHAYGGDFGDEPNDGNSCVSGIVGPGLEPKPAALELAYLARAFTIEFIHKREQLFRLTNKRSFRDLSDLEFRWELTADGRMLQGGSLDTFTTKPGESSSFPIAFDSSEAENYEDIYLTIRAFSARDLRVGDSGSVPAGTELTSQQFSVRPGRGTLAGTARSAGALSLKQDEQRIWIRNDRLRVTFQKEPGLISSVFWDEEDILLHGPKLQLFRAPTDNDRHGAQPVYRETRLVADEPKLDQLDDGSIRVRIRHYRSGVPTEHTLEHLHEYLVFPSGDIYTRHCIQLGLDNPDPLRVGVRCELKSGFNLVTWYGRGPHENYPDRSASAHWGRYSAASPELYTPYIRPQENGARTDVLWASVAEPGKVAMLFHMPELGVMSALPFRPEDLADADHDYELKPRDETVVLCDCAHAGLGTAALGPDTVESCKLRSREYRFTLRLRPYRPAEEEPAALARQTKELSWSRDFCWD